MPKNCAALDLSRRLRMPWLVRCHLHFFLVRPRAFEPLEPRASDAAAENGSSPWDKLSISGATPDFKNTE